MVSFPEGRKVAEYRHPDWAAEEVAKSVIEGVLQGKASPEELRIDALEKKRILFAEYLAVLRAAELIDNMIEVYAPDPEWHSGFLVTRPRIDKRGGGGGGGVKAARTERAELILELANRASAVDAEEGASHAAVLTQSIAQNLIRTGDPTPQRDLLVAIGNVLARAGWRKVGPGMYAPPVAAPPQSGEGVREK